jgi:hypothetical protein
MRLSFTGVAETMRPSIARDQEPPSKRSDDCSNELSMQRTVAKIWSERKFGVLQQNLPK